MNSCELSFNLSNVVEKATYDADVYLFSVHRAVASDVLYTGLHSVFDGSNSQRAVGGGGWSREDCSVHLCLLSPQMSWRKVTAAWRKCSSPTIATLICSFSIPVSFSQWITARRPPAHVLRAQGLNPSWFLFSCPCATEDFWFLWEILSSQSQDSQLKSWLKHPVKDSFKW